MNESKVTLDDGKYTVLHSNGTNLRALRHGEPWRDLTGDGLVLSMVQRIEELEQQVLRQASRLFCIESALESRDIELPEATEEAIGAVFSALEQQFPVDNWKASLTPMDYREWVASSVKDLVQGKIHRPRATN